MDNPIETQLAQLLLKQHLTLSTAESCTGGRIAARITALPGSSAYYQGSVVAYQNSVKTEVLSVPFETIDRYGVVSKETVTAMVKGAQRLFHADCAVATSGVAGPTGGTRQTPVGTIWIAAGYVDKVLTLKLEGDHGRAANMERAAEAALQLLMTVLK